MAGNKALKKFLQSKIPKKGTGPSRREIYIYKEPNTHSEIIGKIKAGESINWINKSICDNREWIRCDKNQNFGYVIGTEEDGNYNFDVDKIIKKQEKKNEALTIDNSTLTNEELKLGEDALNEILNEDDLKINTTKDKNENSTDESSFENTINNKEDFGLDNLNDFYFDNNNFNFHIANDLESRQADLILNEIFTEIDKEQKPKVIEIPKKDENPEKKEELSTFKNALSSIVDLIPFVGEIKSGYEVIFGNDLITNEKLDAKERLMIALNLIPGIKYINKGRKVGKCLGITNKASKSSVTIKASKTMGKKVEKKTSENLTKKGGKKNNTDKKGEVGNDKEKGLPNNYSCHDNFHQAFRQAKKDNDIPLSSQINNTKPNEDRRGKLQPGKVFEMKDVNNKDVELRWDKKGHKFDDGTELPPHINGPNGMHYFYKEKKK